MASTSTTEEEEHESRPPAEDEDTGAQFAPIVKRQEVAVATGEENEDVLLDLRAKLYTFDDKGEKWKERGIGAVKLLKNKETKKFRLVMREHKTLKLCANHNVCPTMCLQEHKLQEKCFKWHVPDFGDGELKNEIFCLRFRSVENCKYFRDKIQEITESLESPVTTVEEENEDVLLSLIGALFILEGKRLNHKEVGAVKLLKNKETKKVRLVLRQNTTFKLCADYNVRPTMRVRKHPSNQRCCMLHGSHGVGFVDGELTHETLCFVFLSVANCRYFLSKINEVIQSPAARSAKEDNIARHIDKLLAERKVQQEKTDDEEEEPADEEDDLLYRYELMMYHRILSGQ